MWFLFAARDCLCNILQREYELMSGLEGDLWIQPEMRHGYNHWRRLGVLILELGCLE